MSGGARRKTARSAGARTRRRPFGRRTSHVEQEGREDPDVGAAGERQEHGGERHDAREPGQAEAPRSSRARPRSRPGGHGGQARQGHVVRERRADPVVRGRRRRGRTARRPAARAPFRRPRGSAPGPAPSGGRRRGPSRSAEAARARGRRGCLMLTAGSREKTAESGRQERAGRRRARQNGERRLVGESALARRATPSRRARSRTEDGVGGGNAGGEKREERGEGRTRVFRYATGAAVVQRPAASEPGRASSISITGMSETIG